MDKNLTERVKEIAKEKGADFVGIGSVDRFKNAPLMLSPLGLLLGSKSVIVVGLYFLDASVELEEKEWINHQFDIYGENQGGTGMNHRLDSIAFYIARFLESEGYKALPIAASNIWRFKPYKDIKHPFAPDLVHRYSGVAAGLGEIGWNGLFLHPVYGARTRLTSIITDAELIPDPIYSGEPLCDRCMECVKNCPTDAYRKEVKKINELEIGGRVFKFPDINKWRCIWESFNLVPPFAEKGDEETFLKLIHTIGNRGPDTGVCMYVCMVPKLRFKDERFGRTWRRKREIIEIRPEEIAEKIKNICIEKNVDLLGIESVEKFKEYGFDMENYLPDINSIIVFGMSYNNKEMGMAVEERLSFLSSDISHLCQNLGYSSLANTIFPEEISAIACGLGKLNDKGEVLNEKIGNKILFRYVFTSAKIKPLKYQRKIKKEKITSEEIKKYAKEKGADLIGICSSERFDNLMKEIEKTSIGKTKRIEIEDIEDGLKRRGYGKRIPFVIEKEFKIKKTTDYLEDAKSIIVLGLHYPDTCLDTAGKTPSETIGPYVAYGQFRVIYELLLIALDVVKFLEKNGYKGKIVANLGETEGEIAHPWGFTHPYGKWFKFYDYKVSRFSALCAGLGDIGLNGIVLTPEFGIRQRFISIITDANLKEDNIYKGEKLCKECLACLKSCPVKAIKDKKIKIEIEGKKFEFFDVDILRCDWAKKYGLVGEEGPKYMGIDTNIMPPEKITEKSLCEALKNYDKIQGRIICICEPCIKNCPVKGWKNEYNTSNPGK